MRLFLAIEISEEARRHLDRLRQLMRADHDELTESISWVKRENCHVTLKFLDEVAEERVEEVKRALQSVQVEPMTLFTDRILYLPPRGPVRVVAVGLGGDAGRLNTLHARIEAALEPLGFPQERRPYNAHITLGRSRKGERGGSLITLRAISLEGDFPGPVFQAGEFVLMHSRLDPAGAVYNAIQSYPISSQTFF